MLFHINIINKDLESVIKELKSLEIPIYGTKVEYGEDVRSFPSKDKKAYGLVMGNEGAGTGASVGKLLGMTTAMKAGLGSYAVQIGDLKVGAIVAVNACGDIFDYDTHEIIAGLLTPDLKSFANTEQVIYNMASGKIQLEGKELQNTTIGVVVTNGKFTKAQMNKIATMAHNGYARTINPVHTTMDGDSIYAMSVGEVEADMDMVGTLAANVMGHAVCDAVRKAEDAYGIISASHNISR
jgi:L-aminopeptidase/D-esterase-like protein